MKVRYLDMIQEATFLKNRAHEVGEIGTWEELKSVNSQADKLKRNIKEMRDKTNDFQYQELEKALSLIKEALIIADSNYNKTQGADNMNNNIDIMQELGDMEGFDGHNWSKDILIEELERLDSEDRKGFLEDVIQYGCESGTVGDVIYTADIHEIFTEHMTDILETMEDSGIDKNLKDFSNIPTFSVWYIVEMQAGEMLDYMEELEEEIKRKQEDEDEEL